MQKIEINSRNIARKTITRDMIVVRNIYREITEGRGKQICTRFPQQKQKMDYDDEDDDVVVVETTIALVGLHSKLCKRYANWIKYGGGGLYLLWYGLPSDVHRAPERYCIRRRRPLFLTWSQPQSKPRQSPTKADDRHDMSLHANLHALVRTTAKWRK